MRSAGKSKKEEKNNAAGSEGICTATALEIFDIFTIWL